MSPTKAFFMNTVNVPTIAHEVSRRAFTFRKCRTAPAAPTFENSCPLFTQERVATNAGLFLEGLLGDEQRKTGWMHCANASAETTSSFASAIRCFASAGRATLAEIAPIRLGR